MHDACSRWVRVDIVLLRLAAERKGPVRLCEACVRRHDGSHEGGQNLGSQGSVGDAQFLFVLHPCVHRIVEHLEALLDPRLRLAVEATHRPHLAQHTRHLRPRLDDVLPLQLLHRTLQRPAVLLLHPLLPDLSAQLRRHEVRVVQLEDHSERPLLLLLQKLHARRHSPLAQPHHLLEEVAVESAPPRRQHDGVEPLLAVVVRRPQQHVHRLHHHAVHSAPARQRLRRRRELSAVRVDRRACLARDVRHEPRPLAHRTRALQRGGREDGPVTLRHQLRQVQREVQVIRAVPVLLRTLHHRPHRGRHEVQPRVLQQVPGVRGVVRPRSPLKRTPIVRPEHLGREPLRLPQQRCVEAQQPEHRMRPGVVEALSSTAATTTTNSSSSAAAAAAAAASAAAA
eukprot:Rhum_TRINITY_DN118_c0_g1::Rhum_TRINITY_DN118_c0_g1_i1::g.353::m.353